LSRPANLRQKLETQCANAGYKAAALRHQGIVNLLLLSPSSISTVSAA
jgi:hypothetical protein